MRQVETERKFDIGADAPLPQLDGVVRPGAVRQHRLRAVYFDTPHLLLLRHRVTLRRREGGADAGWHLKLPRPDGSRLEVHEPLGAGPGWSLVPEGHRTELVAALGAAWPVDGAQTALLPAALLRTDRTEHDLLDDAGRVVAQLCDDRVTALPEGRRWRELEVELVDGDDELLRRVQEAFEAQGVRLAESPSKLARALGDRPERAARGEGPGADDPAGDVVLAYLRDQVATIVGREGDVRADAPDAVHKTRVATRRLRSALRTFRRLLDREATDPLREEVRWFAGVLGEPRDAEVMRGRILAQLEALPQDEVGPVRDRVRHELDGRHAAAHAALVQVLDSERYHRLLDLLVALLAEPPWRGPARRRADTVLPALVGLAVDRARAEWEAASDAEGEERLRLLHETRKRAKAVRYACEALAPAFGDDAGRAAARWEAVTEALGTLQDHVVATAWLDDLADAAREAGEPSVTYGVLADAESADVETEQAAGEAAVREALTHDWPVPRSAESLPPG